MSEVKTKVEETIEEEIEVTEEKKEKFPRTKAIVGKYKTQIGIAAGAAVTLVTGFLLAKSKMRSQYDAGFEDGLAAADLDDSDVVVMTEIEVEPTTDSTENVDES